MIIETIDLYKYFGLKRKRGAKGYLTTYVHDQPDEFCVGRKRPAMLVIGGGGYGIVSTRETEPIAIAYLEKGFNSFTLDYTVAPNGSYPTQLIEGAMAVAYLRENADKYFLLKNKICGIGFSAGGHLLGMLCTLIGEQEVKDALKEKSKLAKLNGAIFSYAVINSGEYSHRGSIVNITGGKEELVEKLSIEKHITKKSPPAFIWCTATDLLVPCENSLFLASAYRKCGVPFELHIFESGEHGASLATKETSNLIMPESFISQSISQWLNLSIIWLKNNGFDIKL